MRLKTSSRPVSRFDKFNAILALPLAALLVPLPIMAQTPPVVVAPGSGTTKTYTTPGGVPVVDINTANAAGLSHNKFTNYNVPDQGLVLNNAAPTQFTVPSQIAGSLTTNFNLKAPATVILTEVVAPNPSTIAGFTEIVGGKADLVVANPYGIAVKGGGFINTDRVTLATGVPVIGANGALTGLRVGQGELSVSGNGLNGSSLSLLDLVARTVKIDGQVNAQDLVVAAGANDFDYATRTATANATAATGGAPAYAVDSSALGGMYANRIRLVATEAGVGVRMLGDAAATADDFSINAAGRVELANKISTERDITVSGAGVALSGAASSIAAKRDVTLDAGTGALSLSDGLVVADHALALKGGSLDDTSAATPDKPNRFGGNALSITTTGATSVARSFYGSGGALNVQSGSSTLSGQAAFFSGINSTASDRTLNFRTTTGDLDTGNAQLLSETSLTLSSDRGAIRIGDSGSGAGIQARGNVTLNGFTGVTNAGNVTAGSDLAVRSLNSAAPAAIANSGKLIAGNALSLGAGSKPSLTLNNAAAGVLGGRTIDVHADAVTNAGTIQGTQGVTVNVSGALANNADAAILTAGEAGRDVSIKAGSLSNAGFVQSTGALNVTVADGATNSGVLATQAAAQGGADGAVTLAARSLTNSGTVQSASTLALTTNGTTGTTLANSGTLQSVGAATLDVGPRFENAATGAVISGGAVSIQSSAGAFAINSAGRVQAAQNLAIGTAASPVALTQTAGAIALAGGPVQIRASTIDNAGLVQASDTLTLNATSSIVNRSAGTFLTANNADKNIALSTESLSNAGHIQSTGALTANITGAAENTGTALTLGKANGGADRAITLSSDTLKNTGTIQSAAALDLNARAATGTALTNNGKLVAAGATKLTAGAQVENQKDGLVLTTDTLTLNAAALVNTGAIQSAKDLSATTSGAIDNQSSGLVLTAGTTPANVALTSATLNNTGTLQSTGALAATANSVVNSGSVLATGALNVKSSSTLTNSGLLQSGATVALVTPQSLQNTSSGKILSGGELSLQSGGGAWSLTNGGRIQSAGTLTIGTSAAAVALDNAANAVLFAGRALDVSASSVANAGLARGTSAATFNVSGAFTNNGSGTVATAEQAGADLSINAGTLTNSGRLQSAGKFNAVVGGALLNTGAIVTASTAEGGSAGSLTTRSTTFTNQGTLQSADAIDISATTAGATSFSNSGRIQAANRITIIAPTRQEVSGIVIGGTDVTLRSGAGEFALVNTGTVQAGNHLALGYFGDRVALQNSGAAIAGQGIDVSATTVSNSGTLQGGTSAIITASGAVNNSGTFYSGGTGSIDAASLGNSGRVQATTGLNVTTTGSTTNTGTIATTSGGMFLRASDLINATPSSMISSGSYLSIVTAGTSNVTLTNNGTIQSAGSMDLTTRNGLVNAATGNISSGGNVTITSPIGSGNFTLTNSGNVQSGGDLTIGTTSERVTLDNQASALMRAGGNFTALATTISNAGTIQGTNGVNLDITGALTNAASGTLLTTGGASAHINAVAGSIANAGQIQSTGQINATASGAIANTGTWLTTGTGSLNATGATISNSGAFQSGGTAALVAASDITNAASGRIQSASDISLTNPGRLANSGAIVSGANLLVVGGSTAFNVVNDGRMQAAQNFTFGSAGARAMVTNSPVNAAKTQGVITAGGAMTGFATTLTNSGLIQSTGAMAINASGALTNNAGAAIQSGSAMTLTTNTTIANAGTIQATGAIALTTPTSLTNADSGKIVSDTASITLSGGSGEFAITNSGRMQAAQDFTFGSTTARAAFVNNPANAADSDGVISQGAVQAGGALTGFATTLVNSGVMQSTGALVLNASGAVTNAAGAKLLSGDAQTASATTLTAASFTNQGDLQARGAITAALSGALTNSGGIATLGTGALTTTSANVTNTGTVDSGGALTMTTNTTVSNSGTLKSAGALALTTPTSLVNDVSGKIASGGTLTVNGSNTGFTITNEGAVQSGSALTLGNTTARAAITNAANATVLSGDTLTGTASTFTNTGTVQASNTLTVDATGALQNNSAGKILTAGTTGRAISLTGASLTNAGTVQSTGAIDATISGALDNSGTIVTLAVAAGGAGGAITATAGGALVNTGKIASGGALTLSAGSTFTNAATANITSAGDATLTTGTTLTNAAGANIAAGGNVAIKGTSAFALNNSGRIQAGGSLALGESARRANLDNAVGATVQSGGDATAFLGALTNNGTVQIGGSGTFTLNGGITVNNNAGAKLITSDALTIDTSGGNFGITNAGLIQSGGLLTIGAAGRTATINQSSTSSKLFADTFDIHAGAVTNKGMIMGNEGGTLTATSFLNSGSGSRFIASTGGGNTTVTITGTLTNEGAIHSSGNFTINAGTVDNTSTGGISSLETLTLNTSGDILNRSNGALYSGGTMTLNAGGNITNFQDATIDSDGNFAATATNVFLNQGQINIAGSATITARTFQNVMAGAENISRVWLGLASSGSTIDEHNYSLFSDPGVPNGSTSQWYYTGHGGYSGSWFDDRESTVYGYFYRKEAFAGIADPQAAFGNTLKPQIAATNLTVNGFDSGKNVGGLLTATGTLAINGSGGGSTFVNDAMVLGVQKWNYQATWWYEYTVGSYDWWNPTGDDHITNRLTTIAFAQDYFSIGAGLRAGNLSVTNVGTLTLLGSANPAGTNATTATGGSMESLGAAADVSGPGATTSAMAVAVTGASVANGSGARLFGRAGAGGGPTDSSSARDTANSVTPDKAQLTSGTGLRGTQNADTANIGTADTFGANIEGAQLGGSRTFGAMSASALANALKNASVSLNGLTLKLPSNPNGLFVPNADPKSKFLVGVNSTFGIDPSSAVGSDELFKILGSSGRAPRFDDNPEHLLKRLGDATYETYLVRQQLVQQLGAKLLNGQKNEADQMRTLMANAASEASRLGLQIGQAPTPAQLAALGKDIVWMVEQVVGGQRVLVPQVYLSAKTKSLFDPTNSTVAGDNVAMDVGSLTNTGGSISGSDSLSIKAKGDITNLSGSISGGDVKLDAGGSIRNETLVQGNENSTVVSKTAGITSTGTMDLSAGKDIKIIGADVKSGGDASISAGGEIVVDTVQKKTTTRTSTGSSGFIGSSSSTTTTTDVKNQGSNLDFGGNLKLKSGGDTTLAGANVNVGGNLDTDVGGNLNVVARQDQHTVDTTEKTSGFGVGGGLYGSQEKTKNDFTGTNFGSTINVGGDANIKAAKTLTLEGSDLKVAGGGSISATDVKVLDGKDEHRVTETTKTTTVGVFTDSSADAGAEAMARAGGKSASASTKEGSGTESGHNRLSAEASASASAEGSGGATIGVRTNTTTTNTYDSTSRASNISFGGNLKIEAKNDLAVRGSNIEAGGDVDLKAKNMQFLAGQDVHTSTTTSSTTTAGLNFEGKGNADASAGAAVGPTGGGAEAGANAFGEVSAGYKVEVNNSTSSEGSTTARVSTIKSGGNLTRTADNKITDVGTSIDVGGDLNQSAKTIESLAAKNTSYSSEDSTTHTAKVGLYADAKASASAEAGAGLGTGAKAEANAEASATAGFKASYDYNSSSSSSSSSEAVVSNIKVGGKMNSKSTEKTTFEGTNIETAGDANIEAKSLEFKAAQNTSTSSSTEKNASAEMKLGVGAGASGGTDGGGGGVGLQGSLAASGGKSTSNESSSEAVTGSINSGGKLKITTKEDMRFEGTNLSSEGDTKLKAGGNVTFDAARNTSESSSDSFHAGGELSANTYGGTKAVSGGLEGGFSKEKSQSSEAVTGSINSGGKLKIEAGGSASFEGTDLAAKGDATIDAKRDVTFKQATSTSSSSSTEFSASLEVGGESNKGEGSSSKSFAASAEGGYSTESEKTAKTSNISTGGKLNIKSGNDVTLQGTNIDAGGDANISAKGNLNLTAKEESSSSFGVSGGLEVGGGTSTEKGEKTTSKSMGANLSLEGQKDVTREGGTIKSGGNVNLSSGKNTTLVGTQVESAGDINVAAGGTVTQKKAESSSVGGAIGLSLEHESEKKAPAAGGTTSATNTPKPSTPETKAGETKAGETGAGEKKDEGPKTGGGVTDLGFNASASSQGTSLKSGSGKVNIQQNVKQPATTTTAPAKSTKSGSSVAPKAPAAPPPTK